MNGQTQLRIVLHLLSPLGIVYINGIVNPFWWNNTENNEKRRKHIKPLKLQ